MRRDRRRGVAALALAAILALPGAEAAARGDDWSPAYRESLRRTAERRKQRRRGGETEAVGTIVPYPMPPALIIRHTPERHDEVLNLLRGLRGM